MHELLNFLSYLGFHGSTMLLVNWMDITSHNP
jgi:hypothetical protein